VLNARWQRTAAFGLLNASERQVGEDLRRVFKSAKAEVRQLAGPTTRRFPLERLRRQIAHAMRLDVLYAPKVLKKYVNRTNRSILPTVLVWEPSPVWKTSTKVHQKKAMKLSSLLHEIAVFGHRANIVHDLVRLSVHVWTLSLRDFGGLCRRILSKIAKSMRSTGSSPDPVERMGSLSTNPILGDRVYRHPPVKRKYAISKRVKRLPAKLEILIARLGERRRRLDAVRIKCLRSQT
jgi:hypothetical protein